MTGQIKSSEIAQAIQASVISAASFDKVRQFIQNLDLGTAIDRGMSGSGTEEVPLVVKADKRQSKGFFKFTIRHPADWSNRDAAVYPLYDALAKAGARFIEVDSPYEDEFQRWYPHQGLRYDSMRKDTKGRAACLVEVKGMSFLIFGNGSYGEFVIAEVDADLAAMQQGPLDQKLLKTYIKKSGLDIEILAARGQHAVSGSNAHLTDYDKADFNYCKRLLSTAKYVVFFKTEFLVISKWSDELQTIKPGTPLLLQNQEEFIIF